VPRASTFSAPGCRPHFFTSQHCSFSICSSVFFNYEPQLLSILRHYSQYSMTNRLSAIKLQGRTKLMCRQHKVIWSPGSPPKPFDNSLIGLEKPQNTFLPKNLATCRLNRCPTAMLRSAGTPDWRAER
jgi:hypothetical protein